MPFDRQIGAAAGGSLIVHLLVAAAATTLLAFHRASAPDNDDFERGGALRGERCAAFGDSAYATRQVGEPAHAGSTGGGSVWWRWRAPGERCRVELQVVGDGFDEVVAVYRGAVLETLAEVASRGAGDGAAIRFVAEPGTLYHVAVAGVDGAAGGIELRLAADTGPQTEPEEIVLLLPEMLEFVPEEVPEDDPEFSRSDGDVEDERPARARFQSDRDRSARGELDPAEEGDEALGTQEGEDLPFAPAVIEVTPLWQTPAGASRSADGFTPVPEIEVATADPGVPTEAVESAFRADAAPPIDATPVAGARASSEPEATARDGGGASPDAGSLPPAPKARTIGKAEVGAAASAATAETALGKYQASIDRGVQASSLRERAAHGSFAGTGFLKVRLWVNREGRVVNTQVLFSDATPEMVDVAIRGLRSAELPPMPDEVYRDASDGLVDMVYDIFY